MSRTGRIQNQELARAIRDVLGSNMGVAKARVRFRRARKAAVAVAISPNCGSRKVAFRNHLLFRRRFPRRTRGCRRVCRKPASISIPYFGEICLFRITVIRDPNPLLHRMDQAKAAVSAREKEKELVKARTVGLARERRATLAAMEMSPAVEAKEARRQEIIRTEISNEPFANLKSTCGRACSSNPNRNTRKKRDALRSPAQ